MQPFEPGLGVRLASEPIPSIFAKPSRNHDACSTAEQFERCLESDFNASSGDESREACQISCGLSLLVVEVATLRAKSLIKVVVPWATVLADIASFESCHHISLGTPHPFGANDVTSDVVEVIEEISARDPHEFELP